MRGTAAAVLAVALVAACADDRAGGGRADGEGMVAPATTAPTSPGPAGDWPTAGHDLANTRAVVGSAITADSVGDLAPVWRTELPGAGTLSTVPIVVDGIVYAQGGSGQVVADRPRRPATPCGRPSPTASTSGPSASPSTTSGCTPSTARTASLALDRDDGAELWTTDVTATADDRHRHPAGRRRRPRPRELGAGEHRRHLRRRRPRGRLRASTRPPVRCGGRSTPSRATCGDIPRSTPAAAPGTRRRSTLERGLVYVGVANPAPFPGTPECPNGTSRPGRQPLHELGRRPRPRHRRAALVPPGDAARPLRPGPGAHPDGRARRRRGRGGRARASPASSSGSTPTTARSGGGSEVGVHRQRRPDRARRARPRWRRAPTAASSRRRRPRTAWCTPPW